MLNFDYVLEIDKELQEEMNGFSIPFLRIKVEDIQERFDFVVDEILKRWPDLKRGGMTPIPNEEKPKPISVKPPNDNQ